MKLFLQIVFMMLDWVVYLAYKFFIQCLFVLFGFWFGFMGGALAQRMDYSDALANQLMSIFGAIFMLGVVAISILRAFIERPNHADTIAKIRARLGFAPRRDDDNVSDIPF